MRLPHYWSHSRPTTQTPCAEGYYRDMVKFMRGFMGSAFKSNDHLEFGVLTGVLRITKESLFSMFIFGMLLALSGGYTVLSNPESGKDRSTGCT